MHRRWQHVQGRHHRKRHSGHTGRHAAASEDASQLNLHQCSADLQRRQQLRPEQWGRRHHHSGLCPRGPKSDADLPERSACSRPAAGRFHWWLWPWPCRCKHPGQCTLNTDLHWGVFLRQQQWAWRQLDPDQWQAAYLNAHIVPICRVSSCPVILYSSGLFAVLVEACKGIFVLHGPLWQIILHVENRFLTIRQTTMLINICQLLPSMIC